MRVTVQVIIFLFLGPNASALAALVAHHIALGLQRKNLAVLLGLVRLFCIETEGRRFMRVVARLFMIFEIIYLLGGLFRWEVGAGK